MKPNILALVSEVASLSTGALKLADRVMAKHSDQFKAQASAEDEAANAIIVAELRQRLADMERRTMDLADALEDAHDVAMTDGETAQFRADFAARIKTTALRQLATSYDLTYFRAQPRSLRPIIASILVGIFEERNVLPLSLWQKLALSDGTM